MNIVILAMTIQSLAIADDKLGIARPAIAGRADSGGGGPTAGEEIFVIRAAAAGGCTIRAPTTSRWRYCRRLCGRLYV